MNEVNLILAEDAFLIQELRRRYLPIKILIEARVARIWQWTKEKKLPFGMISAEKHDPAFIEKINQSQGTKLGAAKINRSRTAQLAAELSKRKLGGVPVRGYFQEENDPEPKPEIAYFVPLGVTYAGLKEPEFRYFLLELGARFDQESILYSAGGDELAQELQVPDGQVKSTFKRLTFNPTAQELQGAWSAVRRHKFVFLECSIGADTVLSRRSDLHFGFLGGVRLEDLHKLGPRTF